VEDKKISVGINGAEWNGGGSAGLARLQSTLHLIVRLLNQITMPFSEEPTERISA